MRKMRPKWLCDYVEEKEKEIDQFILDWFERTVDIGEEFIRRPRYDRDERLYFDSIENGLIIFKRGTGAFTSYTPRALRGTLFKRVDGYMYGFL